MEKPHSKPTNLQSFTTASEHTDVTGRGDELNRAIDCVGVDAIHRRSNLLDHPPVQSVLRFKTIHTDSF